MGPHSIFEGVGVEVVGRPHLRRPDGGCLSFCRVGQSAMPRRALAPTAGHLAASSRHCPGTLTGPGKHGGAADGQRPEHIPN
jgi:hypothetical protein